MKDSLDNFYRFLDRPLFFSSRLLLATLLIPLLLSFQFPLWHIQMHAPQYPQGLDMWIYSWKIEGGNDGHDIQEINVLNHYIGMEKIDRAQLNDLDWLPFAFGIILLMALRLAAVGNVRTLIDQFVLTAYIGGFGMARFAYKLYTFGHYLDPKAPIKAEPFMPPVFGVRHIANFTAQSYPDIGTWLIVLFSLGLAVVTVWHLVVGRIEYKQSLAEA